MYNVRVSAEFVNTNLNETTRREGDLSEIHVADIYRREYLDRLFEGKTRNCL